MRGIAWVSPALLSLLLLCQMAAAEGPGHDRLKIVNQCDDDVWAVFTPGGSPAQPAVEANSGAWFRPYATQEDFEDPGWLGTIAKSSATMTLSSPGKTPPGFVFVAGQIIKVKRAGAAGADLTTTILKVINENTVLMLKDAAKTAVIKATVLYDTLAGAVLIKGNGAAAKIFAIPDQGAPNGNFRFFMGCPSLSDNSNPFDESGCVVGSIAGDLAAVNTLFEPTFGCVKGSKTCAFNPAANPAKHRLCPTQPNAKNCGYLSSTDYYDISAVDGYTLPLKVEASGVGCSAPLIDGSMLDLGSCPSESSNTLYSTNAAQQSLIDKGISLLSEDGKYRRACIAPFHWFETTTSGSPANTDPTQPNCANAKCTSVSYYAGDGCDGAQPRLACPGGSGPQQRVGPQQNGRFAIQNTNWVTQIYGLGYTGYTWQYGDGVGNQTCPAAAKTSYTVTLCPEGGKPYEKSRWKFSAADGDCAVAPDGTRGRWYPSLAACQRDNMLYVCDDLTASDPFKVPGALWRADADATKDRQGYSYMDVQKMAQLECEDFPVSIAGYPSVKAVPICYQYYGKDAKLLCPVGSLRHEHRPRWRRRDRDDSIDSAW